MSSPLTNTQQTQYGQQRRGTTSLHFILENFLDTEADSSYYVEAIKWNLKHFFLLDSIGELRKLRLNILLSTFYMWARPTISEI